jgi:hypothetical protein
MKNDTCASSGNEGEAAVVPSAIDSDDTLGASASCFSSLRLPACCLCLLFGEIFRLLDIPNQSPASFPF